MLESRTDLLLDVARRDGQVLVSEMAARLGVSPHTIRRDLAALCEAGTLERTHGGAVLPSKVRNIAHRERRATAADAKTQIAARLVQDIAENSAVFLGIGTTVEAVARALLAKRGLMILTNSLHAAAILSEHDSAQVHLTGGRLRLSDRGLVGAQAATAVAQFRADLAVIGISAIEADGTLTDFDAEEVAVSQAAIQAARRAVLVADAGKCTRKAPLRVSDLSALGALYTDAPLDPERRTICAQSGTAIILPG